MRSETSRTTSTLRRGLNSSHVNHLTCLVAGRTCRKDRIVLLDQLYSWLGTHNSRVTLCLQTGLQRYVSKGLGTAGPTEHTSFPGLRLPAVWQQGCGMGKPTACSWWRSFVANWSQRRLQLHDQSEPTSSNETSWKPQTP